MNGKLTLLIDTRMFYASASTFVLCGCRSVADYFMVKRDLDIGGSILYLSSLVVWSLNRRRGTYLEGRVD